MLWPLIVLLSLIIIVLAAVIFYICGCVRNIDRNIVALMQRIGELRSEIFLDRRRK